MKKRKFILLALLLLSACSVETEEEYIEKSYPVEAMTLLKTSKTEIVKYVGILQPEKMVEKTFENVSEVEKIYVEEGDTIKVGDLLAKQNTDNLESSKEQLSEQITQAEAEEEAAYQRMLVEKYEYEEAKRNQDSEIETLRNEMLTAETKKNEDEIKRDQAQVEYATADSEYQIALTEYNEAVALRDATDPSDPNYAAYEADVAEKEAVLLEKQTIRNEKQAALTTANAEYNTSVAEYESAETRYNLAVEEGVSIDVEVAEAEYNAAEASYEAAHSQTNITRTSYESVDEQIEASYLYSDIDGYVLRLVAEEGEVSNPLVPALVIGSSDTVATIGISQNNIRKVKIGMDTRVLVGDLEFKGEVLSISKIPDQKSRTYETDISFPEDLFNFYIGESAVVEIIVGEQEGIWIPINIVQNDGQDYVYTIKDNRVIKKIITTSHIDNDYVMVNGLKIGDVLITNGMKGLKPGYLINIVGDANDE